MTIRDDIHDTIHAWISYATELPAGNIVPANEPGAPPEPTGLMITILTPATLIGTGAPDDQAYDGSYHTTAHREGLVSLQAKGPGALEAMDAVDRCQATRTVRKLFRTAGLVLVETRGVRDLTAPRGQSRLPLERAQMDVLVRLATTITEAADWIAGIDYDLEVGPDTLTDFIPAP